MKLAEMKTTFSQISYGITFFCTLMVIVRTAVVGVARDSQR